jgi:hypothetical protein
MVDILQFAAVAAYLLWCLCASLTGASRDEAQAEVDLHQSDKKAPIGWTDVHHRGAGGRKGVR